MKSHNQSNETSTINLKKPLKEISNNQTNGKPLVTKEQLTGVKLRKKTTADKTKCFKYVLYQLLFIYIAYSHIATKIELY